MGYQRRVHGDCTLVHSRDRFWWFLYQYKPNNLLRTMAYSWDNRVKFVVRYMYDIDGNGSLDKNDFECLAVRNTVIEGKGDFDQATFKKNQEVMANLWNEIAELADFNKDGEVSAEEFLKAIEANCGNKTYDQLPPAFKAFITGTFKSIDVDGDGTVGLTEYRVDCVNRMAYKDIKDLDAAYEKLLNDDDKKAGGITLARYQELYAQFIGNPDESCNACYLFGPLEVIG